MNKSKLRIKIKQVQTISLRDWDNLVMETYGRPYSLQQQDGCHSRGSIEIVVPSKEAIDYENDTVPEIVNHSEMGVSFKAWLARDPKQKLPNREDSFGLTLWWDRNFYPSLDVVANDLHQRGLLAAGEYSINIDW
jgi:hypothetical protein